MPPVWNHRDPFCDPKISSQVKVAWFGLRYRGVSAVGAADGGPHSKAAFGKVQAIAHHAPDPVIRNPADQRGINPALQNQVLYQAPDRIFCKRRDDAGSQPETAAQAARHVVFTAAFPNVEMTRSVDAALARIEPQHHFAQTQAVPSTFVGFHNDRSHISS